MDEHPTALDSGRLAAIEPRFAAWLAGQPEQAGPPAQWQSIDAAARFYAAAVIAGTAADLGPFLADIDAAVFAQKHGYGLHFADRVIRTLIEAGALAYAVGEALPPTLRLAWDDWYALDHYDSRHDTWSYGAYAPLPPATSGY
ncbi:MAG TPA: hypothetical protein VD886_25660 [Herpetosiphonaceae bacterium]|nr:hypothetical protein [Herpetosiphonaceae bacterium]